MIQGHIHQGHRVHLERKDRFGIQIVPSKGMRGSGPESRCLGVTHAVISAHTPGHQTGRLTSYFQTEVMLTRVQGLVRTGQGLVRTGQGRPGFDFALSRLVVAVGAQGRMPPQLGATQHQVTCQSTKVGTAWMVGRIQAIVGPGQKHEQWGQETNQRAILSNSLVLGKLRLLGRSNASFDGMVPGFQAGIGIVGIGFLPAQNHPAMKQITPSSANQFP